MIFTQEQIDEIKRRLAISGTKDTQLPLANIPVTGEESISIVQNGENKLISLQEMLNNELTRDNAWLGSGLLYTDIMTDDHKISSVEGSYKIDFNDTGRLILIVPKGVTVGGITMNGFDVPMEAPFIHKEKDSVYYVYMSKNLYLYGSYVFALNTYKGSNEALLDSIQSSINELQENTVDRKELTTVALSGSYNDLTDKPFAVGRVSTMNTTGIPEGYMVFDTLLGIPVFRHNNSWVDAAGNKIVNAEVKPEDKPFEPAT